MSDIVTFSLEAGSCNNFYRGHEPSNKRSNCWGDEEDALVLTIKQARALAAAWRGSRMRIVVSLKAEVTFTTNGNFFQREVFCAGGGDWYLWPHIDLLRAQVACDHLGQVDAGEKMLCENCGALSDRVGHWYNRATGVTLDAELKV